MATAKHEDQCVLDRLPDSASFILQKVESSRQAVAEGRVLSQEEVERRMEKWLGDPIE